MGALMVDEEVLTGGLTIEAAAELSIWACRCGQGKFSERDEDGKEGEEREGKCEEE